MSAARAKTNPFPGLRPFTQAEDFLFFGREEQTLELLQRLGGSRFVAVVGTSGSGKSSLVRCGLLSELLGGGMLGAGSSWEIAVTHPGGNPLSLLTDALLAADLYDRDKEHARENLLATLSRSQFGLVEAVKQADLGEGTNFLLVVDQFEEIFRFHEAGQWQQEAANEFVSLLLEAAGQRETPIYVVLTMRSDFIGECGQFEGLAEMVNRGEFLIPRLTREQYKRAIEGPIKVAGGQIEPRLLQRLLNDLGQQADQLPCLQHALMRTWDVWAAKGDTEALDLDEYQRVGRMSQALSLHADEIHDALASDRQRDLCKGMFQALTVEESNNRGIRRPQRLGRLCQILEVPAEELVPIIDAYRRSGVTFLTPSPEVALTDQTIIDLSHESLIRVWTRLRQWVEEETQAAGIYHRLSESASLNEQGKAGLYRDPELGIALAWREAKRPNAAWAERYRPGFAGAMGFLEASQQASVAEEQARDATRQQELERSRQLAETQARAARLFKRFAGVLAVGLCLAVALTVWAFLLWREAIRQEEAATFYAGEANVQANLATENANKAEANARKAEAEAGAARSAEQEAKERAKAEAAAKALAEQEKQRANDNARKAEERAEAAHKAEEQVKVQLTRAEWLVYAGKLTLAQNDFEAGNGGFAQRYLDECQPNLRGWEHRYLWTRISAKQTWAGNAGEVWSTAYSPDGKRVVVGSQRNAMVWDAEKGEELLALKGHARPVRGVAYSSDGTRIVTGGGDPGRPAEAKVWDAATGRQLLDLKGISGEVWSVAISPDGGRVVTGAGSRTGGPGEAKVWDARTGKERFTLKCPVSVAGVAFSPDGKRIVTGAGLFHANSLSELKVWDAETGEELLALKGHKQAVMSVAYSPDGKRIVSGAGNPSGGETKVWDAGTGREIFTLKGHAGGVTSVAFSPDNLRIVTGSSDNTMKLWDAATGAELLALKGHLDGVTTVAFSPDGRRVVTGGVDTNVKVWDAESGQEVLAVKTQGGVRSVAFSRDGNRVATGSDGQSTKVWDVRTGREVLDMNTGGVAVAFSPDGKRIATDAGVRDAETGKQVLSLKGHTGSIRSVAYSPDGKRIATGSEDQTAKVWDADSGKQILTLKGHTGGLTSVAFSPDGKRIVTGGDSAAKVWDADKGRELISLKGHTGPIRCVAFSPDGQRVVTGSLDKTARVWDAETGRQIVVLEGHTNWINGVAFSSDGKRVATASEDKTVKVWDAGKGQELLTLKGHTHVVFAVAFSPDGKRLVTGSYDQTAKVWNAEKSPESRDAAWPLPDAAERKRHHTEQSALALQQKQWFAAEFHLGRVLRDDPENALAKSRLAQIPFVIASDQKKFALAARLWAEALAKDPKIGDDLQTQPRYHAACTAALAAAGQGMDEPALDDAAKAKLRLQAFDGLKAELTALDKLPESGWPKVKPGDWRRDSDLAGVRDPAALAKLPAAEQMQWQAFWTKVAAFSSAGEHFQRGLDLSRQGNSVESVAEYRAAIRRRPDFAEAYCNLGLLLGKQGDYAEALEMRRKGHELGSQRLDWKYPSAQWVAQAERALVLLKRLPAVLQGKDKAADNAERLAFAQIAYDQHQFVAASRLWGDALASDPKLGDDRQTQHRYNAACAAALAAAGQGKDGPPLDDAAKVKLRRQALDSLKTELTVWDKLLATGPPQDRPAIVQNLKHWQDDTDLAGIRDKAAMAKLPADEQKAFTQLWADVAALLKRAEP